METTTALASVPHWLMEPESSIGSQYQSFYIPNTFDDAMGETDEVPFYARFHTSSARDEPVPTLQSITVARTRTSAVKSQHALEADRFSKARFDGIFADMDGERAAENARQKAYSNHDPVPSYHIGTGVRIEDSRRIFGNHMPPELSEFVIDNLRDRGARPIYNSEYPPVAAFLRKIERNPDQLHVMTGKGRNVREWTTMDLPSWYTSTLNKLKVPFMNRVCFVVAALWVYDKPEHPAHRLFWSSLTCRPQSSMDDKQLVWERTAWIVQGLLDMKDDCPVDCTNRGKFAVDILGLQQLAGQERVNRSRKLFPTRWVPELGPEGLGADIIPSGPRLKKRKAEAPPATEQPINSGATPAASPRKRVRVISFAEPPRKSGRVAKAKIPEAPARKNGDATIPPRKNTKAGKLRSALKKTNTSVENAVTAKAKIELMATVITTSPPDAPMRSKQCLSKRKADVALPSSSSTIPPKPSCLNLVTPMLQSRSSSSKSGSPGSSTAVSPVSGDSRGGSTSCGTAVESPEVDLNKVNGKRKRVDEPEDIDSKVGEALTKVQVETVGVPRRTTRARTTKLTAKAAAAISNAQPVEAEGHNRKQRKTAHSPQKKGKV